MMVTTVSCCIKSTNATGILSVLVQITNTFLFTSSYFLDTLFESQLIILADIYFIDTDFYLFWLKRSGRKLLINSLEILLGIHLFYLQYSDLIFAQLCRATLTCGRSIAHLSIHKLAYYN